MRQGVEFLSNEKTLPDCGNFIGKRIACVCCERDYRFGGAGASDDKEKVERVQTIKKTRRLASLKGEVRDLSAKTKAYRTSPVGYFILKTFSGSVCSAPGFVTCTRPFF